MHRDGALTTSPRLPDDPAARLRRVVLKAAILGAVLQIAGALLVHLVPPFLGGHLYPVLATLLAAGTGLLVARGVPDAPLAKLVRGAARAALGGGLAGVLVFALLGHLALEIAPVAVLTCGVAGAVAAPLGRLRRRAAA